MRVHIKSKRYYVNVTGTLTVSEQSTLYSVSAGKQAKLAVCNGTASVIMGMKRNDNVLPVHHILAHILYLTCVNVRKRHFNGNGQIDYNLIIGGGLPYVKHRIAYLKRKFRLCSGKALGRILKLEIAGCLFSVFLEQLCSFNGYVNNLVLGLSEYLFSLCYRGGIIQMYNCVLCTCKRFKRFLYDVFS